MDSRVEEFFIDFLKKNKLKNTPERLAILKELLNVNQHFDADEFFLHLKKNSINVSRATVYRTLELLQMAGMVRKSTMGESHAHYEFIWNQEHHDHLICSQCGKIIEFFDEEIEKRQRQICERHGFVMRKHNLQIWGVCKECQNKN